MTAVVSLLPHGTVLGVDFVVLWGLTALYFAALFSSILRDLGSISVHGSWNPIRYFDSSILRCLDLESQYPLTAGFMAHAGWFRVFNLLIFENTHYRFDLQGYKRAWAQYEMIPFVRCGWPEVC